MFNNIVLIRVFCNAWILCLLPLVLGLIKYDITSNVDIWSSLSLNIYLLSYVFGVLLFKNKRFRSHRRELKTSSLTFRLAVIMGTVGVIFQLLDFFLIKGGVFSELSTLRESFVSGRISIYSKLSSVCTWGGFFVLIYVLRNNVRLRRKTLIILSIPSLGIVLSSILSAGRQSLLQFILIILVSILVLRDLGLSRKIKRTKIALIVLPILVLGIFITLNRNSGELSSSKVEVLQSLFEFDLNSHLIRVLNCLPLAFAEIIVELIVYLTNSLPLYGAYYSQVTFEYSYGATNFPFLFRQLEPLTGIVVSEIMADKAITMREAGAMPFGWTNAFSGFIGDFGKLGAVGATLIVGMLSQMIYNTHRKTQNFSSFVLLVSVLLWAIYSPLFSVFGDTNIFLLSMYASANLLRK